MAIMKEYRKQPTGLDKQEWQGYTSTSGQRLPSVSRRQLYGQQCIHTSGETISSVYGYHSLPSICSITIFIETFSPPSMYFECVYAYKTGSQSEVNSFFGWTDFTIYSSCLLFCSISYFLQSTYIIYTKNGRHSQWTSQRKHNIRHFLGDPRWVMIISSEWSRTVFISGVNLINFLELYYCQFSLCIRG